MKLGILKEINDPRVAIIPASIPKIKALGLEILVESDAGSQANFNDHSYGDAVNFTDRSTLLSDADIIISINPIPLDQLVKGKTYISQFEPYNQTEVVDQLKSKEVNALSMDMIPRTTRAQAMDVLSSMASIAGYRAVLEAANYLPRYFPMMITAAGSVKPSQVLVLGAGVAGLQAIATAKRLGAMVEAFDTRSAAKEEVKSLGAKFIEVEGAKDDKDAGGYAVQQSEDFIKRQQAEVQNRAAKADIIITTAQVRGRKAPLLVPKTTIDNMKPGSVIVDLAASTGGNCELTENDQVIQYNGVTIIGNSNLASKLPQDASFLYSNNLVNFLKLLVKEGTLNLDLEDDIIKSALITHSDN